MPIAFAGIVRYWSDENRPTAWTTIMTLLFFPLLVKGSNVTVPNTYDGSAMSSPFISTTTAQENEAIYLWIPLIIVIIFAMIITTLIIVGRQSHRAGCKCLGAPSNLESSSGSDEMVTSPRRNLRLNVNLNGNSSDPIIPETPPPSYAVISRQISYISTISQTSSQIEVPPGYDEAIEIPDGGTPRRSKNWGSQQYSSRGSASSQGQGGGVASRIRLFSRSLSASDSPRRPALLQQPSTPADNRHGTVLPSVDAVPEHPELEHPPLPATPTILDIIHEATTGTEDVHLDNDIENNGSRFYIDESELHYESTS